MSKNDWESGTLKIPTKAWKPLRDGLATAFNERQARLYELALKMHAILLAEKKLAKRGAFKLSESYTALMRRQPSVCPQGLLDGSDEYVVVEASLRGPFNKRTGTLLLPKKKDFPLAVATKTVSYTADLASISLRPVTYELEWDVSENNHAVESSRNSYMGRTLFELLAKVEWTRGSGGTFVGNDEYRSENKESGGGGNYVTMTFAMKTKADLEAEAKRRRVMNGYGYGYGRGF